MDGYEATRIVFSRIQSLEPENASKIMGLLLLQDHGEKEMIRLAFGPETLVHSVIVKAKKELGLMSGSSPSWCGFPSQDELISPESGGSVLNPASLPFYANGRSADDLELHERLSFLDNHHGQSKADFTVADGLGCDGSDLGLGWGPCSYFARGFCKSGGSCRFVHGSDQYAVGTGASIVGSPGKIELDTSNELLRSKAVPIPQQPRLAHQLIGGSCFPYSPKSMNLQQSEGQRAAALVMGEEFQKFGRQRPERNDFPAMASPAARQIYLTFPADSAFREEDVSNYFSTYGPVQDVRIPYQQKRMFGFVTFVYPETVKIILAKGNPHFVCDSRVLVKPYKEKGKVPDKYRPKQTTERVELSSPCGTPTALEARDPLDFHLGARMLYNNTQDLLWRRKLEEQALELQSRRLMTLQLLDVKKHFNHSALSNASPVPSPTHHLHSPKAFNQTLLLSARPGNPPSPLPAVSVNGSVDSEQITKAVVQKESLGNKEKGDAKEGTDDDDEINLPESLEDSPSSSPTHHFLLFDEFRAAADTNASASSSSSDNDDAASTVGSESFKSLDCQIPRFVPGHGVMGILPGSGGPTCPVGI